MPRFALFLLALAAPLLCLSRPAPAQSGDFATILDRARDLLLQDPPAAGQVEAWVDALGPDGRWPDVDYDDRSVGNWRPMIPLKRINDLFESYYAPESPLAGHKDVADAATRALNDWVRHGYEEPQWWHRDIGVPMMMRDLLVLARDDLSKEARDFAVKRLQQFNIYVKGTQLHAGANLVWTAELGLMDGVFRGDGEAVEKYRDLITKEIHVSTGEGIQPDASYHQHGPRLQTFHYGGSFLADPIRLATLLRGTPWAVPQDKIDLLAQYVLDGPRWQVRGPWTVPGTVDRAVGRPGTLRGDLTGVTGQLVALASPPFRRPLREFAAAQEAGRPAVRGFKDYPYSDFAAYHRPSFSAFVKTITTRTQDTEHINGDNQKGHLLNCGDWYFLNDEPRDKQAYFEMPPVWDWSLLPGVIWAEDAGEPIRRPFGGAVAGAADGGVLATDFAFGDAKSKTVKLSYARLWAFRGDGVLCLVAPETADVGKNVRIALDQRRRVAATVADLDAPHPWLLHDGLAYFPPTGDDLTTRDVGGEVVGRWRDINTGGSTDAVHETVFLPTVTFTKFSQPFSFAVVGGSTVQSAAGFDPDRHYEIVANTPQVQAVWWKDAPVELVAAFRAAGSVETPRGTVSVDRPCVLSVTANGVAASDPLHKGGPLVVKVGDAETTLDLPEDGTGVAAEKL